MNPYKLLNLGYLDMEFFHILVLRDNESLQTLCKKIDREPKGLRSHFLSLLLSGGRDLHPGRFFCSPFSGVKKIAMVATDLLIRPAKGEK